MPDTNATTSLAGQFGPLHQLLDYGGPVMGVLLVLALVGLATFIYAILVGVLFAPRASRNLKTTVARWEQAPGQALIEDADRARAGLDRLNPLPDVVTRAMRGVLGGATETQQRETVARLAQRALQPFESPLKIIEVIAALAPLLGLLGTVMGMMEAFSTMASTAGRASASQLSGGIYQALMTTAAGLVIAIPMAAMAAWMEFRLRRLSTRMNDLLVRVLSVTVDVESGEATDPATQAEIKPVSLAEREREKRFAHATG
ncbi:MotA/TolQ/ExbB proton channel family protein [Marinobacter halodurans]|uniref:MotA/TolQ/ExbB proton channel family protein n=1 Tax=Marinobacter halodurans TaxID=2528979 RepID=A0ABY1ZDF8_9GAMM|nr:MotA/TolQ/ExbB proton channel family protein [Marinobacter halodurans]TBW46854.1 MotA/TolQ/ExbB proton channel family protein [Marinobacter halodurans]